MSKIYETKSTYVFETLKERILNGTIRQGENLVISKLSEEFQVSIIPIREAISRLESEGLVKVSPHKGATVTELHFENLSAIIEVRGVLEAYAARLAAAQLTEEDFRQLEVLANRAKECAEEEDFRGFFEVNAQFHRMINEKAGNEMLTKQIYEVWDGDWSKNIFLKRTDKMAESAEEHFEILDAMRRKDYAQVEQSVRKHKNENIGWLKEDFAGRG